MTISANRISGGEDSVAMGAMWSLVGTLVYAGCQWGVLVTAVRLTSPEHVGLLSLGSAISAPVFLFLQLRLRTATATDASGEFGLSDYLSLRLASTALALVVTMAICIGLNLPKETVVITTWVAIAKALESGSDLLYGFSQRANDLRTISISMAMRGLLSLVAFGSLLWFTKSLAAGLMGICSAWGVVLVCIDIPTMYRKRGESLRDKATQPRMNRATLALALSTLPLGLSTMLNSLSANMPRYAIDKYLGSSQLGVFAATGYLAMAVSVIVTAVIEAAIAKMAVHIVKGEIKAARSLLRRVVMVALFLSAAGVLVAGTWGRQIIRLCYGGTYSSGAALLTWMMVISGIANIASVYGFTLITGRHYAANLQCQLALTACIAAANFCLVRIWGLNGAVAGCVFGYSVGAVWAYQKTEAMFAKRESKLMLMAASNEL